MFVNQKEMVSKMFAGEEAGFQFLYYLNILILDIWKRRVGRIGRLMSMCIQRQLSESVC